MRRFRTVAIVLAALLLATVILQNTESVETRFLFWSVIAPRALTLALTLTVGFGLGVLTVLLVRRHAKRDPDGG